MSKKQLPRLAVLAAAAWLAGCSFMPAYERPAAPVAAQWPVSGPPADTAAQPVADIPWQRFVSDARLRALIELSLENNRDLRVAVLNIDKARAQYRIQRADRLPTIGVGASGSRTPQPGGEDVTVYQAGLTLSSWELDFFGRVASLSEAALGQYLATEEGRKSAQISLVSSVANAYLALLADDELLALTRQTLATREDSARLSRLRFDSGVASELDWRQAQSLLEAARATLAQLQRQRAQDQNLLTLLVGQPDWAARIAGVPAAGSLESTVMMAELPAGLPSDVLTARPDIRQAEQLLRSANANIGAARAAFFPRITLTAGFGTVSTQLSGLFESGSWGWSVAPQLLLPIFDAGRNQAGLDVANVNRDIALAQYEKAIQTAFREVADALAGRATLGEELRAQQAQAEAEATRFRLSDLRYRNGVASYLDLLDAQRSLFATQQAVVQTRLAQLQNQVALYRTLGGGWTAQP
ncbi:efflux transporter outer membrane subunit [Pseudorhodoferax sp.]|uniref:efflux transporter outer membrane subunit n=1 Tax=Pseudorhodoferax sp. TaxID=1993553 RepID=UPI0039E421DD